MQWQQKGKVNHLIIRTVSKGCDDHNKKNFNFLPFMSRCVLWSELFVQNSLKYDYLHNYCKSISQNLVQNLCCFWYVEFSHDNPKITTHFLFWSSSLSTVIRSITHRRMLCRLPFEITFCSFKNLGMDVTAWVGFVFNYLGIRWCYDFIFMNIMNYF